MARGRRYDGEAKLNIKKVIAVIVLFLVIIMFIVGIRFLLTSHTKSISGKIEAITYYTVYENSKWGVINSYGETVIKPIYNEMLVIPDSTKALFICTYDADYEKGEYKAKAINEAGKDIITGYDKVEAIANFDENSNLWYEKNVLRVQKNGKYGLVDFTGKELLACEYDNIESLKGTENELVITNGENLGLCDVTGNIIIEPKFKKIEGIENNYKNGYIVVDFDDKYGIIGFDKSVLFECNYDEIKSLYGDGKLFVVKTDEEYQVIDKEGEIVLNNKFDDVLGINGDDIIAKKDGKCGVINISGETKLKYEYSEIKKAGKNYIVKSGSKYGVVGSDGEEKLAFDYVDISYVPTGDFFIANYIENGNLMSKIVNSNFDEKIKGIVLEVNEAKGYIRIYTNNDYKYYNFKFEEKPSNTLLTTNTLFLSKKDGKYGFVDKDGNILVDYTYDDATEQNTSGYAAIKKDGLWGAIDSKGNVVLKPKYNLDNNTKVDFIGSWHLCEDMNANYYLDV